MTTDDRAQELIRRYDDLLETKYKDAMIAGLQRVTTQHALRRREDGLPLARSLRPLFLSSAGYDFVMRGASTVGRAMQILCNTAAEDQALRRTIQIPEHLEKALEVERLERRGPPVVRFDGFQSGPGQVGFIEANPFPGSFVESEVTGQFFVESPILRELSGYRFRNIETIPHFIDSARAYGQVPAGEPVALGLTPRVGADVQPEGLLLVRRALSERGVEYIEGDPHEMSLRDGKFFIGDRHIFLLIVHPLILFNLQPDGPFDTIWRAVTSNAVRLIPGPSAVFVMGNKNTFEVLSDETHAARFGHELFAELQKYVPWTRIVRPRTTTFEGKQVDLLEFMVANRERLVLKPAHASNAVGVVLGWQATEAEWSAAIEAAQMIPHVVQARVPLGPTQDFPLLTGNDSVEWAPMWADINPYFWHDGNAHDCLVRLSGKQILNVATGGAIAPLVVFD